MRILIADDNQDAAACLQALFDMAGHEVRLAFNGRDALALAQAWHPHAAILDLRMPVMDGVEAAKALRTLDPDVLLVALTARTDPSLHLQTHAAGFDLCFNKAVDFDVLRVGLERMLQRSFPTTQPSPKRPDA